MIFLFFIISFICGLVIGFFILWTMCGDNLTLREILDSVSKKKKNNGNPQAE